MDHVATTNWKTLYDWERCYGQVVAEIGSGIFPTLAQASTSRRKLYNFMLSGNAEYRNHLDEHINTCYFNVDLIERTYKKLISNNYLPDHLFQPL